MHATGTGFRVWNWVLAAAAGLAMAASGTAADTWMTVSPEGRVSVNEKAAPQPPSVVVDGYDDTGLEVTVDLAGLALAPEDTKGGRFLSVGCPETPLGGKYGTSALPVVRRLFTTPVGATVELQVEQGEASVIDLKAAGFTMPVLPMQPPIVMEPGALERAPFHYDESAYATDALLPVERVTITELGIMRGRQLHVLEVRPFAYNPVRGTLAVHPHFNLSIRFQGGRSNRDGLGSLGPLRGVLLNPQPAKRSGRGSGNYLIVMGEAFDGIAPMTQFIDAKTAEGFTVLTYVAPPNAPVIRAYIQSLWDTSDAPDYLLLAGDSDTIPVYYGGGEAHGATDLPYACMDPGDDWYPDMAIGRFTVRTESQLQAIVDKTLYVAAGDFEDPTYAERAVFMAGTDTMSGDEGVHNWVINTYMTPNAIEAYKLYMRTYGADTEDVSDAFNNGCFLGVFYGHSWDNQWQSGPPFSHDDVQNLTNEGKYPFLFNFTCAIGAFTLEPCFLEVWIRAANKGAVAAISSSNYIYSDPPGWPETVNTEKFLFDSIYLDGLREVSPAWQATMARLLAYYGPSNPVCRDYAEMFNLQADPSLQMPLPPPPNYLIIAPEDYAGSAEIIQFAGAKTAQGFRVLTYDVPSGTSNASIKTYIEDLWGTPDAPDYILLVGDTAGSTSTSTTIPHWTGGGSKHATTDLPYACMDAGDDWHPDIAVGRFSVSSLEELQDVVAKSVFVEAGSFPDPMYVKRGAFLANPSTCGMAEPTHDWVIDHYFTPKGYEGIKLYAAEGADTQDVADAVNNGCLWVGYYGHSGSSGWWAPSFYQEDVRALTNAGLYGVAWSFSCNVGNYSLDECFGETWLREADKGAAAVIFPSYYIYWGSPEAWEPATVLEHSFFRAFFKDDIWEVGPAWQAGLYHFLEDFDGDEDIKRNFFELYNLLGDPALRLPQPDGFTLTASPESQDLCCPPATQAVYDIEVGLLGTFSETVTLSAEDEPAGATVDFDVNHQVPPFTSVMTVGNLAGAAPGEYHILITGTSISKQRSTSVKLGISDSIPAAPVLTSPPNGAEDVSRTPTLTWEESSQALDYDLEVAQDSGFLDVVYSTTVADTSHTVGTQLDSLTEYYWHVRAVNGCGDSGFSSPFSFTTLEQADYFTEQFDTGKPIDLEYFTVVFIPDGSGDYYDMCGVDASELPTDPTGGTTLYISEDSWDTGTLSSGEHVQLYDVSYDTFYANDNGNVTFTGGDSIWQESLEQHFSMPRISAVFDDFSVANGTVSWKQLADRAAVTYEDVPEYGTGNSNTFQVEMFFNGEIHITWLGVDSNDSIVGLSEGNGLPEDFLETDLSAASPCFATGACCVGETCTIESESDCLTALGEYQGDETDCDPNPCITYESTCLIISEVVDGALSGGCPKFIEITNTGLNDFSFIEGGLIVQMDSSTDVEIDVDLSGVTILAGQAYVINSNEQGACWGAFPVVFGFEADHYTDVFFGNGNDRYILTDTADGSHLLDIYGDFGVDGTGEAWEYTDGYAYRLSAHNRGSGQDFAAGEWFFSGTDSLEGEDPEQILRDNTTPGEHVYDEDCVQMPGDLDNDGDVDMFDFSAFQVCFGQSATGECELCNLAGGDVIDLDDFALLAAAMGGP